jgi:hypothetical protein
MNLATWFYECQQSLMNRGIILSFTGFVSESTLYSLGEALKQTMARDDTDMNVAKKVFSVFVEQAQNIVRYSADRYGEEGKPASELGAGIITVGRSDDRFFVMCGNLLPDSDVQQLRERLEIIRNMDKEQLKAYYREKLKEPPEVQSKGASIGLIEIARRASGPVEFDFLSMGNSNSFFCLKAYI